MNVTGKKHLSTLRFNTYYSNEINIFNSDALIAIASGDIEGLEACLGALKHWRETSGDSSFPKEDYQIAMEYFLKKMKGKNDEK